MKQQIREATAFGVQPRILIHDNDGIYGQFGKDRRSHLGYRSHLDYWLKETIGIRGIPITPGCPQETPHIERFNRTLREEALNHFVFFGEAHVHRVVSDPDFFMELDRIKGCAGSQIHVHFFMELYRIKGCAGSQIQI